MALFLDLVSGTSTPLDPPSGGLSVVESGTSYSQFGQASMAWPAGVQAGDTLVVAIVSPHDVLANKTLPTPTGFTSQVLYTADDYIPSIRFATKTAVGGDAGAALGGLTATCRRLDWMVLRGGSTITPGTGVHRYGVGTVVVPAIDPPGLGCHIVAVVVSDGTSAINSTDANYTQGVAAPAASGYSGGKHFYRLAAPDPTTAPTFGWTAGTGATTTSALSVHVRAA